MIKKLETGNYEVSDMTTDSSQRFSTYYYFRTMWNKKLELLKFELGYESQKKYREIKLDRLDRRNVLAKNRHLKELKINLGLLKVEVEKEESFIIKTSYQIIIREMGIEKNKTIQVRNGHHRKDNIRFTRYTDEKWAKAKEIDRLKKEFKEKKYKLIDEIFEGDKK